MARPAWGILPVARRGESVIMKEPKPLGQVRNRRRCGLALLVVLGLSCAARAQQAPEAPVAQPGREQLQGVERDIERSTFEQRRLQFEIENIGKEEQALRRSLIDVTARVRASEERVAEAEARLEDVTRRETALRRSLQGREKITGEVLAAMQRIGRKPPPAVLAAPEDALSAVRAAILLGAVLPDLRDEALILVADLKTLVELRRQVASLGERLQTERVTISAERTRLGELVEARQKQLVQSREQLEAEKTRVATLTRDARSLRDLISRSESEIIGAGRAVELARRAPPPQRPQQDVASLAPQSQLREAVRLQPRVAFAESRGQLVLPVSGVISRRFGEADGIGGVERGITVQSQRDAVVSAPADGSVNFAGPYRGYGHLVIINAGGGYLVVLAGLVRLNVEAGQFVLAGEPLGYLGQTTAIQPGENIASSRPALYVEFRKDGSPIDPSPWWAPTSAEKARG
jgi:septal ring factor EnvC (AmiA/AmiB activator)